MKVSVSNPTNIVVGLQQPVMELQDIVLILWPLGCDTL